MRTLHIRVDDEVAEQLENVAPGRQSEFAAMAIRKALWDLQEQKTAEAYGRQPDSAEDAYCDPKVWEP